MRRSRARRKKVFKMRKTTLGEYADVVAGVSYNPADIALQGVRILRGGNIQNGEIVLKQDDVFLDLKYKSSVNQVHCGDTIVVASTGSTDALGKAATSWCDITETQIGAFLRIVRPKERKYAALVSAWLTQPIFSSYIVNKAKGTGINNIRREHLLDYKIEVQDDDRLAEFSALYEAVESKITLNRKKIEKLEALAKTIYDYWFVQFDFPDANGRPYKSSGGKMVYNPILKREMPEEWEVLPFAQCIDFTMGQSPSGETLNETNKGTLFYQGATDFGDYFPTPRQYTTLPVRKAMPGDVLLSVRAPVGTVNIADDECCIGRGVGAFRRRGNAKRGLLVWFHLKSLAPYFDRKNNAGTTFGAIGKEDFLLLSVPKPSDSLIERYENMTFNMSRQMLTLHKEIRNLTNLRDFLLPLLMNGQVEVGE